ncbi:MAG: PASTA domain-containing protein [bacterium]
MNPLALRGKNLLVLVGGVLVAFVVGLIILNTLIGMLIGHGHEVEVPDLAGLAVEPARERLAAAQLSFSVKSERPSGSFEAGKIITQFPKPLARVKPGRRIEVIVSTGIERVAMPNLAGASLVDAKLRLNEAGLVARGIARTRSRARPRDVVLATSPGAGAVLARNTEIDLLVSNGSVRAAYVMPSVVGRNVDDVVRVLAEAGLQIGEITERAGSQETRGNVILQSPVAGAYIAAGETVSLIVAGRR